jgi:hypothetical protein
MKMASIISFSVFELFTFISFFFSIASLIILSYILIRRRNILTAAKKRSIQKSQIKSSQIEIKLNDMLQKKDKEIIELKHFLQKYMDIESVFLKEIQSFEPKSEVDYPSFIEKLKTQIIEMNNFGKNFTDKLKNSNQETEKYLFSQVLKKKHPFLTDQEIGLCTYFRMNTPSKEIAVLEGITDGTVRVYKNKIKNKIGLSQLDSLNEYLLNIPLRKTA